jgi:hypothetical protein
VTKLFISFLVCLLIFYCDSTALAAENISARSREVVGSFRDIIVILSDLDQATEQEKTRAVATARSIYAGKQALMELISQILTAEVAKNSKDNASDDFPVVEEFIRYVSADPGLRDAD